MTDPRSPDDAGAEWRERFERLEAELDEARAYAARLEAMPTRTSSRASSIGAASCAT
jgi:hypothetical protein